MTREWTVPALFPSRPGGGRDLPVIRPVFASGLDEPVNSCTVTPFGGLACRAEVAGQRAHLQSQWPAELRARTAAGTPELSRFRVTRATRSVTYSSVVPFRGFARWIMGVPGFGRGFAQLQTSFVAEDGLWVVPNRG